MYLGSLGVPRITGEDYAAAIPLFRRVMDLGLAPLDVPVAQKNLAVALIRLGEIDDAEALLREIVAEERRLYGDEHPKIAFSLSHLGEVMVARGRVEEAES